LLFANASWSGLRIGAHIEISRSTLAFIRVENVGTECIFIAVIGNVASGLQPTCALVKEHILRTFANKMALMAFVSANGICWASGIVHIAGIQVEFRRSGSWLLLGFVADTARIVSDVGGCVYEVVKTCAHIAFFGVFANGIVGTVVVLFIQTFVDGFNAFAAWQTIESFGNIRESRLTTAGISLVRIHANRIHVTVDVILLLIGALIDALTTNTALLAVR
jgi:hypothetical protein